ncbi:unnamed protein product [Zymoseptoria tritici ST99CH_3D7]|uniref:Uncharacterized protein n=1 Tax=Zymoseptoria tritici (strain ST99CH_3D7) TaxID=1276538 RepID=A0A1X7RFN3_ZYMT9|nr:unnamed protein product [Zymoseptoria tritici ST99CH_3D7]
MRIKTLFPLGADLAEALSFYEFLPTHHLHEDCLKRPPGGQLPQITPARFAALGKTDTVFNLLRHLPDITQDGQQYSEDYQIGESTVYIDYTGVKFESSYSRVPNRDAAEPVQMMDIESWDRFQDP